MSREALYEPAGWALLRAPLLPVGAYSALSASPQTVDTLAQDPRMRAALLVASAEVSAALGRASTKGRNARRVNAALLRYLIRMSTRPTPYGLFAAVGLVPFGAETDIHLTDEPWRTRARPDMGWLLRLVLTLEARTEVRRGLKFFANPSAYEKGGRVHLLDTEPTASTEAPGGATSLRASAPVRAALAHAGEPVPYDRLLDAVLALPDATPDRAHQVLDQLWGQSILLTELRPPATTTDPLGHVLDRLRAVPAAQSQVRALEGLAQAMRDWDGLSLNAKAEGYPIVVEAARRVHDTPAPAVTEPIQVDLAMPVRGAIHTAVARQAAIAAETLLRLTSRPTGSPRIHAYRQAFVDRYADAHVPLLDMLDERTGLGPLSQHSHQAGGWQPSHTRQRALRDIAIEAVRDGRTTVQLDDRTLRSIQTWDGPAPDAPLSLDIALFVLATSPEALDRGDFQLMVGPNVGASAAGRWTGRFADLLGPPARKALAAVARQESALSPDAVLAEVSHVPSRWRSMNVTIRPLVRAHEIAIGTRGAAGSRLIDPADLLVSIREGRFTLRFRHSGREVLPRAGHMLNNAAAPHLCQFLDEVGQDNRPHLGRFDWGPAAQFPFLPRVEHRRLVLAPAQWRVDAGTFSPPDRGGHDDAMDHWRKRWAVPRHVYLSFADNRLLLDLDNQEQAGLLRAEMGARTVVVQEALPGPEHAWLPGPDGPRLPELIVPLIRVARDEQSTVRPTIRLASTGVDRIRPVGSEWLYLKLYGPENRQDELIRTQVLPLAEFACQAGLCTAWFFIRYADPQPHLRLRLRGDPATLLRHLLPEVAVWANDLVDNGEADRWCFDNYEREVERYGGPVGVDLAENIAAVDSVAVARLLTLDPLPADKVELAVKTIDDMLHSFGLDVEARRNWCNSVPGARQASGLEYRRRKNPLRSLLSEPTHMQAQPNGTTVVEILAERQATLARLAESLDHDRLSRPIERLLRSHVHLHCNRLLGGRDRETQAIGLLKRTLDTLTLDTRPASDRHAGPPNPRVKPRR